MVGLTPGADASSGALTASLHKPPERRCSLKASLESHDACSLLTRPS